MVQLMWFMKLMQLIAQLTNLEFANDDDDDDVNVDNDDDDNVDGGGYEAPHHKYSKHVGDEVKTFGNKKNLTGNIFSKRRPDVQV